MSQHPRPVGPAQQNNAATFSTEMAQGSRPPERRIGEVARHRQGQWAGELQTILAVPFTIEMTFAARPVTGRPPTNTRGPAVFPFSGTTAPDSIEMWAGSAPATPRLPRLRREGIQWWTPDVQPFTIEMVVGSRPDRPRILLGPKIPLPVSQPTHTAATFTPDMADGYQPDRARLFKAPEPHLPNVIHIDTFSIDMILATRPERPVLTRGTPWTQTLAQPTHTAAAFTPDMADGWMPDQSRYRAPKHDGVQWLVPVVSDFQIEMLFATRPERARIRTGNQSGVAVAQPTHVSAPVTVDMLRGWQPDPLRWFRKTFTDRDALRFTFDTMVGAAPSFRVAWARNANRFIQPPDTDKS